MHRVAAAAAEIDRFHDVDLPRGGPAAVGVFLWQQPERGPKALAGRQADARLDAAVAQREAAPGVDPRRGELKAVLRLAPGGDDQVAVFDAGAIGQIPLQLVVAPAGNPIFAAVAGFKKPSGRVKPGGVEFIAPDQPHPAAGRDRRVVGDGERGIADVDVVPRRFANDFGRPGIEHGGRQRGEGGATELQADRGDGPVAINPCGGTVEIGWQGERIGEKLEIKPSRRHRIVHGIDCRAAGVGEG